MRFAYSTPWYAPWGTSLSITHRSTSVGTASRQLALAGAMGMTVHIHLSRMVTVVMSPKRLGEVVSECATAALLRCLSGEATPNLQRDPSFSNVECLEYYYIFRICNVFFRNLQMSISLNTNLFPCFRVYENHVFLDAFRPHLQVRILKFVTLMLNYVPNSAMNMITNVGIDMTRNESMYMTTHAHMYVTTKVRVNMTTTVRPIFSDMLFMDVMSFQTYRAPPIF